MRLPLYALAALVALGACYAGGSSTSQAADKTSGTQLAPAPAPGLEVATFAGGCFWCMEPPFEKQAGVKMVLSGYTGGKETHPAYKQVAYGRTGHTESVRVYYDPDFVTYEELVDIYWQSMDPTDAGGQFADRGTQYRPAIFVHDEMQKAVAATSKKKLVAAKKFGGRPIVVPIQPAGPFWVAEDHHQDFYLKDPKHYARYRRGSGRTGFLEKHWGAEKKK